MSSEGPTWDAPRYATSDEVPTRMLSASSGSVSYSGGIPESFALCRPRLERAAGELAPGCMDVWCGTRGATMQK